MHRASNVYIYRVLEYNPGNITLYHVRCNIWYELLPVITVCRSLVCAVSPLSFSVAGERDWHIEMKRELERASERERVVSCESEGCVPARKMARLLTG